MRDALVHDGHVENYLVFGSLTLRTPTPHFVLLGFFGLFDLQCIGGKMGFFKSSLSSALRSCDHHCVFLKMLIGV
jgi:hypothetical protein